MVSDLGRILLEDKKGNYSIAKFAKDNITLEPSKRKKNKIQSSTLDVPKYKGKYSTENPISGTNYGPLGKPYNKNQKYFAQMDLSQLIDFSNILRSKEKADYVLLKDIQTKNLGQTWGLSAEIFLMKFKE